MARAAITGQHVRDRMTFHAVIVAPDDTVSDALDSLAADNVAALPVVDDTNRVRREANEACVSAGGGFSRFIGVPVACSGAVGLARHRDLFTEPFCSPYT